MAHAKGDNLPEEDNAAVIIGMVIDGPKTYEDAMQISDSAKWKAAINHELDSLIIGLRGGVDQVKRELSKFLMIKVLGPIKHLLGMKTLRGRLRHTIRLSQEAYIEIALAEFGMDKCHSALTPLAPGLTLSREGGLLRQWQEFIAQKAAAAIHQVADHATQQAQTAAANAAEHALRLAAAQREQDSNSATTLLCEIREEAQQSNQNLSQRMDIFEQQQAQDTKDMLRAFKRDRNPPGESRT